MGQDKADACARLRDDQYVSMSNNSILKMFRKCYMLVVLLGCKVINNNEKLDSECNWEQAAQITDNGIRKYNKELEFNINLRTILSIYFNFYQKRIQWVEVVEF